MHRIVVTFEVDTDSREDAEEKVSRILDMLEGDFVTNAWFGADAADVKSLAEHLPEAS